MTAPVPDPTAVRVALWRALHLEVDGPPPVMADPLGVMLVDPPVDWRARGDMHPEGTRGFRAAIVGRARFVEELVQERVDAGVTQYVLLGAGLDTFAERHPELGGRLRIFEIDAPRTQAWKSARLDATVGVPAWLTFVPVDFESGASWTIELAKAGFDRAKPALIASTGVSMYLTRDAVASTLREVATLAPGSTLAMTFLLPPDRLALEDRAPFERVIERAAAAGTPFLSLFAPDELLAMARAAGLRSARHVGHDALVARYFQGRSDGLSPSTGEDFLVADV